jgi:hypothetical protein
LASATDTDQAAGGATAEDQVQLGTLLKEAVFALDETQAAISAIDAGNNQEAIDALARATGKLEIILTREPNLALAPVAIRSSNMMFLQRRRCQGALRPDRGSD